MTDWLPTLDPYWEARQAAIEAINKDRRNANLPLVEWDQLAAQVADYHCQEMAGHGYIAHWNLRGLLPHHRYHFAGGGDHIAENSSRLTVISSNPFPISAEPKQIRNYLIQALEGFMAEKPPIDLHRINVLDPSHTHVGIGFAVSGRELRMSQLFVNRYVKLAALPKELPKGAVRVDGEMLRKDFGPYYCMLFSEGNPVARTPQELNLTYSYSDTEGEEAGKVPPWDMEFSPQSGRFRFSIRIRNRQPGYYHLLIWVRNKVREIPYRLYPGVKAAADTKDAIPCAGWVFQA